MALLFTTSCFVIVKNVATVHAPAQHNATKKARAAMFTVATSYVAFATKNTTTAMTVANASEKYLLSKILFIVVYFLFKQQGQG